VLAKKTIKNQITLPKTVVGRFAAAMDWARKTA
jgi:hypothetical protein